MGQIVINSVCAGAGIALFALAFNVVYLPTGVFYIAIAGIYSIAPYFAMEFQKAGMPPVAAWFLSAAAGGIFSLLMCYANHAPIARRGLPSGAHIVSSLGIYMILVQTIALIWGNDSRVLRSGIGRTFRFADAMVADSQIVALGVSATICVIFFALLRFGSFGLHLRAMADNPTQMALLGYNVGVLRLSAFWLSGMLAAVAGMLSGLDFGFSPHNGMPSFLLAVAAAVIGGKGTFTGPIIGGMALGFIRVLSTRTMSAQWQDAVSFAILAVFLFFRPHGILGGKARLEASES